MNRYEIDSRATKVQRLIETIDRIAAGVDANTVYHWLKGGTDERWAELSLAAQVKTPSATTRAQVLALLMRRAWIYNQKRSA